jgi:hypothetical protein
MHKRIRSARKKVDDARAAFKLILKDVQNSCKHQNVAETRGYDAILGYHKPRRICEDCGWEEEAWSWPGGAVVVNFQDTSDRYTPTVLNTDRVRTVDRDDFYRIRP